MATSVNAMLSVRPFSFFPTVHFCLTVINFIKRRELGYWAFCWVAAASKPVLYCAVRCCVCCGCGCCCHLQGLGAALAKYLSREGAKLILSARSADKLQVCT